MSGFVLDAGALIAYERQVRAAIALVKRAHEKGEHLAIPAGVVGQVWRDGRRQVSLARLLSSDAVEVVVLDDVEARMAGQLCGVSRTADVIDASVVLCAQRRDAAVATSDPEDLHRLDPSLRLLIV